MRTEAQSVASEGVVIFQMHAFKEGEMIRERNLEQGGEDRSAIGHVVVLRKLEWQTVLRCLSCGIRKTRKARKAWENMWFCRWQRSKGVLEV